MALAAVELDEPGALRPRRDGRGRRRRTHRRVQGRDARTNGRSQLINAGLYAFDAAWLRDAIKKLTPQRARASCT